MANVSFLELIPLLKSFSFSSGYKSAVFSHGSYLGKIRGYEDELMEYRKYIPGDDLRFLDWKVYARTDKYYIREGYQHSKQSIIIWLDNSVSQRFTSDKYNIAWLLSLCIAYLFKKINDNIFLYFDFPITEKWEENLISVQNDGDFIQLNDAFVKDMQKKTRLGAQKKISYSNTLDIFSRHAKTGYKIIWITDLYVPMLEYENILNVCFQNQWKLSLLHLTQEGEWRIQKDNKKKISRIIDLETGEKMPSGKIAHYETVWEEAIDNRIRLLIARNFNYLRGSVEDGPIKIIHQMCSL